MTGDDRGRWADVFEIQKLKARYFRFMDTKQWDLFGELFTFEVDREVAFEHRGWSVVVVGRSCIVPTSEEEALWMLKLWRWVGGGPETLVRIEADQVSGREIGRPGARGWLPDSVR